MVTVTNVSLPKASFVKLQPQSVDFLEISNPRAVLEHALRNFSCVTKGDVIQIPYNNKNFHFALKEVEPQDAACIIETDCNVDFDAPVGYKEPDYTASASASAATSARSSACPSPTTGSTTSSTVNSSNQQHQAMEEDSKPAGIRIVDGKIIRPEEDGDQGPSTEMLADRTGSTGVQKNAAIPEEAPEIDYWAVNAGDGARLDGKAATPLKDKGGNEVDIRRMRAEAAARRAEAAAKAQISGTGKTLTGEKAPEPSTPDAPAVPVSKRKTKVGGKYSRLKQSSMAFKGSANKL